MTTANHITRQQQTITQSQCEQTLQPITLQDDDSQSHQQVTTDDSQSRCEWTLQPITSSLKERQQPITVQNNKQQCAC